MQNGKKHMKSEESVGCVMVYENHIEEQAGKQNRKKALFLLMQSHRGDWNFVKGHRESGESDEETLRREIYEETGITDFKLVGFVDKIKYRFLGKAGQSIRKEVWFYLALSDTMQVRLSPEHINFRWAEHEEATGLLTFQQSVSILEKAIKMKKRLFCR
jgi:8-oxo-dGTP pyrophosphatase MutT (NUDIX family)